MRRQPRNRGGQYKHSAVYNWRKKKNRAWSDYQPYAVAIFGLITWLIFAQIIPVYAHIQNETGFREILNSSREPLKIPSSEAKTEGNHDELVSTDSDSFPRESDDGGTDDVPTPSSSVEDTRKEIVKKIAKEEGIDPKLAIAICTKESGCDPTAEGDYKNGKPTSFGMWQIHKTNTIHTDISVENAKDVEWSTRWSMKRLKANEFRGLRDMIRSHNGLVSWNDYYVDDVLKIYNSL